MIRAAAESICSGPIVILGRGHVRLEASLHLLKGPPVRRDTATKFEIATEGGFSLLEVVLVTVIITIMAALAVPQYGRASGRHQADLAARRVAADLRQGQLYARMTSASCTATFTVATSTYQLLNVPPLDGTAGTYTVDLRIPPYKARIVSASFNGGSQVVFNGWGLPDKAGTVIVAVGSEQRTITLNAQTGQVAVQ